MVVPYRAVFDLACIRTDTYTAQANVSRFLDCRARRTDSVYLYPSYSSAIFEEVSLITRLVLNF